MSKYLFLQRITFDTVIKISSHVFVLVWVFFLLMQKHKKILMGANSFLGTVHFDAWMYKWTCPYCKVWIKETLFCIICIVFLLSSAWCFLCRFITCSIRFQFLQRKKNYLKKYKNLDKVALILVHTGNFSMCDLYLSQMWIL